MKRSIKRCLAFWLSTCALLTFSSCNNVPTGSADRSGGNNEQLSSEPNSVQKEANSNTEPSEEENIIKIQAGDTVLTATLVDNTSTQALLTLLSKGPLTIEMEDYGNMEKVGDIGSDLPRNDEQITTQAGDLILYQGNSFVIYYSPNSWNFTRLGHIVDVDEEELQEILGEGDVTVTLFLE